MNAGIMTVNGCSLPRRSGAPNGGTMYQGQRFSFRESVWWTRHSLIFVALYATAVCSLMFFTRWKWLALPWQPVGTDRCRPRLLPGLQEQLRLRPPLGGSQDLGRHRQRLALFRGDGPRLRPQLKTNGARAERRKELVHRHVAWLHMLVVELRKLTPWEHQGKLSIEFARDASVAL